VKVQGLDMDMKKVFGHAGLAENKFQEPTVFRHLPLAMCVPTMAICDVQQLIIIPTAKYVSNDGFGLS
jgi:hypothetical protein